METFKSVFQHIYIELNTSKLTYIVQVYNGMFPVKNGMNNTNISCRGGGHKRFQVHYGLRLKIAESVFSVDLYILCYCTNF